MKRKRPEPSRVAVYCGSELPESPLLRQAVVALGEYLAGHDIGLVFGGTRTGSMGLLADTVLAGGGEAIGVFCANLPPEQLHPGLSAVVQTGSLAERKAEMLRLADAVVALPGSLGTLDELFDALALRKVPLGGHRRPVGLLNVDGYYDLLLAFLAESVRRGFSRESDLALLTTGRTPAELFAQWQDE